MPEEVPTQPNLSNGHTTPFQGAQGCQAKKMTNAIISVPFDEDGSKDGTNVQNDNGLPPKNMGPGFCGAEQIGLQDTT